MLARLVLVRPKFNASTFPSPPSWEVPYTLRIHLINAAPAAAAIQTSISISWL